MPIVGLHDSDDECSHQICACEQERLFSKELKKKWYFSQYASRQNVVVCLHFKINTRLTNNEK